MSLSPTSRTFLRGLKTAWIRPVHDFLVPSLIGVRYKIRHTPAIVIASRHASTNTSIPGSDKSNSEDGHVPKASQPLKRNEPLTQEQQDFLSSAVSLELLGLVYP